MAVYSSSAVFNAVDNISGIVDNIGTNVVRMGDRIQQQMLASAQASSGLERAFGTLAAVGIGPVMGVVGAGIDQFVALENEMATMSVRTGMTGADLDTFKGQVRDAFANQGVITNIGDMARVVEAVKKQTQGLADTDLTRFTGEVVAVAKAYGIDPANLADQVGKVQAKFIDLKNASPEVTLDNLLKVAQDTGEPLNQIADIATKYGSRLAGAGLTGTAALGLIDVAIQGGVTNFADLTKSVEFFHNKLSKPSYQVTQALNQLGMKGVVKDLAEGRTTFDQVLSMVYTKLNAIEDPAQRAKIETTLFGQAAQKIGGSDVLKGFADFTAKMDGAKDTAKRATETMDNSFGGFISRTWNNFTTSVSTGVDQVWDKVAHADWQGAIDMLRKPIEEGWNNIFGEQGFFRKAVPEAFESIGKWITDNLQKIFDWFDQAAKKITSALKSVGDFISDLWKKVQDLLGLADKGPNVEGAVKAAFQDGKLPGQAGGGPMQEGLNLVGEQGPELAWKRGSSVRVFTAQETHTMFGKDTSRNILGSGTGGTGGGTVIHLSVGTLVGSGGMQELARILVPYQQRETARRSTG